MTASVISQIIGSSARLAKTINYEIIKGNEIWRFLYAIRDVILR